MTADDRKDYSRAVYCLMNTPSRYNKTEFPGARTRFDDYVAHHISVTPIHHGSVRFSPPLIVSRSNLTGNNLQFSFMSFHRYFVWAYESELRDTCGYKGAQPVSIVRRVWLYS
jgi:tyrosinase